MATQEEKLNQEHESALSDISARISAGNGISITGDVIGESATNPGNK